MKATEQYFPLLQFIMLCSSISVRGIKWPFKSRKLITELNLERCRRKDPDNVFTDAFDQLGR